MKTGIFRRLIKFAITTAIVAILSGLNSNFSNVLAQGDNAEKTGSEHGHAEPKEQAKHNGAGASEEPILELPEFLPNFLTLVAKKLHDSPSKSLNWIGKQLHLFAWENIAFSFFLAICIIITVNIAIRKRLMIPDRAQNLVEMALEAIDNLVCDTMGSQGRKYTPFIATIFIYIFVMNMAVLVPGLKSPTSYIAINLGMAIIVFFYVQLTGIREAGILGYLHHMAGSPEDKIGWGMSILMFPLHVMEELIKPVSLSLRLFGNILGEDALIGVFVILGVALTALLTGTKVGLESLLQDQANANLPSWFWFGIPLQIPFMLLAILTGTIQALVFALLSTIYIFLMLPHEEEHH